MKPFIMKFRQGKDAYERDVYINMNQVCYIASDHATGSVLTFCAVMDGEPAYVCVNTPPDEIFDAVSTPLPPPQGEAK